MKRFTPEDFPATHYLFFTGKGGVGKTSVASALSLTLSKQGKRVLLISTDPASNLQDVFGQTLTNHPTLIHDTSNLYALNLDPIQAAAEYKERMIAPYKGKLPEAVLSSMEEQMSGACTVEIAAFNQFSSLLTDKQINAEYDVIVFDTAPTGHTLRLLQLPTAWSGFLEDNTNGASCLGPLAGLESQKQMYSEAVKVLSDANRTTLLLVSRPEEGPLREAARASNELKDIGISNQQVIINGLFEQTALKDHYAKTLYERQQKALQEIPTGLSLYPVYYLPLAPFSITGTKQMEKWLNHDFEMASVETVKEPLSYQSVQDMLDFYEEHQQRVIFTMGKGGVGKTTVASLVALGLAERGKKVHLTTTDPAAHIAWTLGKNGLHENLSISSIDPKKVVQEYKDEVISKASETMDEDGLAYIKEDLESPCTEEIAVFRAFADVVAESKDRIVVIDTAPTGHTLLLLDASEAYHKEISRSSGEIPESVRELLPKLRDESYTSIIITTLPEATPVFEATRLEKDLQRANIAIHWWVINQSFYVTDTLDAILAQKAQAEKNWIQRVNELSNGHMVIIPWSVQEPKGTDGLNHLL
ncbi:arsenical pump-driving ATPase [Bacillus testis]|uniref:arsenical pump-driving ATPase n=1 Tax=Bacillus testis TaxID=1622072 RepID=UPI00067E8022|nr:arsenical pump-driving ATPase [Bacillus testis]